MTEFVIGVYLRLRVLLTSCLMRLDAEKIFYTAFQLKNAIQALDENNTLSFVLASPVVSCGSGRAVCMSRGRCMRTRVDSTVP